MEQGSNRFELTDEDIAAMARVAGLPIPSERLSRLRDEMQATLTADRDLDATVRRTSVNGGEPFDPAWNPPRKGGSR